MNEYFLLLVDNGVVVKKFSVGKKGRYLIGRSDDVDLVISSKDVSRHHAALEYDGKKFIIEDLNSTNGTFVNGVRIKKEFLNLHDEVTIGDYLLLLDDGTAKLPYPEATELGRKGEETVLLENKFISLRRKIKDSELKEEFKKIESVVKKSRKRLSVLAHEDRLTGLYNRQYFDKMSKKEFTEAKRNGRPLSVLFIDIDHFKKINDTYGHSVGDDALKVVAQLIKSSCRKSDLVARYGGEEIVVILPNTVSADAFRVGRDINRIIAEQTGKILGIKITVSIGTATFPADGGGLKKILECADKALYQAKRAGRNRVVKYEERSQVHREL